MVDQRADLKVQRNQGILLRHRCASCSWLTCEPSLLHTAEKGPMDISYFSWQLYGGSESAAVCRAGEA